MRFWDRLFGKKRENSSMPDVRFGRYSDVYKTDVQYDAWDEALVHFERGRFQEALDAFFTYLYDARENNVHVTRENEQLHFEILQGSKKVTGFADNQSIKAAVRVARAEDPHIGFMRRLLENNFTLKFTRYALDENDDIVMLFDSSMVDATPYKLYYALKELATNADKQDDLLLEEFQTLSNIDSGHIETLSQSEIHTKVEFVRTSISKVLTYLTNGELSVDQYPGGYAYLFLSMLYKLDYLVKPEGFLMEILERQHRSFFAKDGRSDVQKIEAMHLAFKKLLERPENEFAREFYNVSSTFGITSPVNHDRVIEFIDGELGNMDWYQKNGYLEIALAIPEYITGYCMFNFAVPAPDRDLFHLYYHIIENEYFLKLGFPQKYQNRNGELQGGTIRKAIRELKQNHQAQYPEFAPDTGLLHFGNPIDFSRSYMLMMRGLDLTKAY